MTHDGRMVVDDHFSQCHISSCHQSLSWLLRSLRQFSHTADCVSADLAARARFGPIRGRS